MGYIMVTADFPGVTKEQRAKIYASLEEESWNKVTEPGRDIDTVWYVKFEDSTNEASAKTVAKNDFETCSAPFCVPKLAIHFGPNKPIFYNLV